MILIPVAITYWMHLYHDFIKLMWSLVYIRLCSLHSWLSTFSYWRFMYLRLVLLKVSTFQSLAAARRVTFYVRFNRHRLNNKWEKIVVTKVFLKLYWMSFHNWRKPKNLGGAFNDLHGKILRENVFSFGSTICTTNTNLVIFENSCGNQAF